MTSLSKHIETPVFYIFDEHNELFNKNEELGYEPSKMNYFRTYKQWAGPTSGVKYKIIFRKKLLQYIQVQHIQNLKIIYLVEKKIN